MAFYIEPSLNTKANIYRAHLSNNISVYTSELIVITEALKWILPTTPADGKFEDIFFYNV